MPGINERELVNADPRLESAVGFLEPAVCLVGSVPKFSQKANQPNGDGQNAESDPAEGCRRIRSRHDPARAGADYSERNEICQYRVVHTLVPTARTLDIEARVLVALIDRG
jgi:hypothetical protein